MKDRLFMPARLRVARERRGMKKVELGSAISLSPRMITDYEGGVRRPSAPTLARIAQVLRFPRDFFFGTPPRRIAPEAASFRALSTLSAGNRDAALATASLAHDLLEVLDRDFTLPDARIPDLAGQDPEVAAQVVRDEWELGQRPIGNMIHLLESKGVRILSLVDDCRDVDAFTFWATRSTPVVFLNTTKSAERSRFDAAHELGHLVLHRDTEPRGRATEREADAFAAAFLMPAEHVLASAPHHPSLLRLKDEKMRWGVSIMAYARRLADLDVYPAWQSRQVYITLSQHGYRTAEPTPMPRETSQVLAKIVESYRTEGTSPIDLAERLRIPLDDLSDLTFGLIPKVVAGGHTPSPGHRPPMLHVVPTGESSHE